ncbi:MAG TPA: DUF4440 domain-containing protein [Candidatus Limnocylindrales bacterium]|nr:DUF4440 domain-containing protein [Candidatus Limnocylindrales bacterium]
MNDPAQNTRDFAGAIARGDSLAASSSYTSDALLQPPNAVAVAGRDAIAAFWRAGLDSGVRDIELTPSSERVHEGFAFELGVYVMRIETPEADSVVDRGRYLLVHERQADGSWLYAVEMLSPDLSAEVRT